MNEVAQVERSKYVGPTRTIGTDPHAIAQAQRAIALMLSDQKSLKAACREIGLGLDLFNSVLSSQRELSLSYVRAQEILAEVLAAEVVHIADTEQDPQKARNMIDARKWTAKVYNQKKFGERIDLNVTQTLDIAGTLMEARQRMVRPLCDQQDVTDAQVLDLPSVALTQAADNQSPDIFGGADAQAPSADSGADGVDIFS